MAIEITDIITEFGAYYKNGGQNEKQILTQLTQGLETPKHCTSIMTDDTVFQLSRAILKSLVQPFQKTFTPKGGVKFNPNEIRLFKFKVDDEVYPDEIEATWLGFLADNNVDRKTWPLVRWMVENYYIPQINNDMEVNEYFNGVYAAPVSGTAGPDGTGMNGLKHLLKNAINSGSLPEKNIFVSIGALDKDNIFDQIEEAIIKVGEVYRGVPMEIAVSPNNFIYYMRDKRAQGFYQKTSDKEIDSSVDFSLNKVVSMPSMVGFDYFYFTPKANLLHCTKKSTNKNKFLLESSKRAVAVMADWYEGLGFGMDQIVWTNWDGSEGSGSV